MMWLNNKLVPDDVGHIYAADRGFTLGDGLFETLMARHGKVVNGSAHFERLQQGCSLLNIPYPNLDLTAALHMTLSANNLREAAMRITLTRGVAPRGLLPPLTQFPTLVITATPLSLPQDSARCIIASITRRNEYSPLSRIKALSYLDNILALQEAVNHGGNEAILLNTKGKITGSSRANIFVIKEGILSTPPLDDGVLPGTMRARIVHALPKEGYSVIEQSLTPEEIYGADEIFLTNSLGFRSVVSINGRRVGTGQHVMRVDLEQKFNRSVEE